MKSISSHIINAFIRLSGQRILIPFYHAVTDRSLDFTKKLYPPRSIASFIRDLDVLMKYFKPISLQELIKLNQSSPKLTQNYFHLTFDDGLSNFYEEVAPILEKRKIPATIFLNTNFVDNKDLFFRYKASLLLNKYNKSNQDEKQIYKSFIKEQSQEKTSVSSYLLSVSYQNKDVLDDLAKRVGVDFMSFLQKKQPYLTLPQIKTLQTKGYTFGAHSLDHPLFTDLSLEMQLKQASESIDWVTDNLDTDIKAFSFPFEDTGVSKDFFDNTNIDISFGTFGIKKDVITTNHQRISFELADENAELYLFKEYSKYLIKVLFGKHIIKGR